MSVQQRRGSESAGGWLRENVMQTHTILGMRLATSDITRGDVYFETVLEVFSIYKASLGSLNHITNYECHVLRCGHPLGSLLT